MLALILVLIDQAVKYYVHTYCLLGISKVIIPGLFNITYLENTGAAFSILSNNTYLIIIVSFILLFILYKYLFKHNQYKIVKSLILSGIISNLIDRVARGYVIDYFDFNIFGYNAPVFNIADICIVIGCIIFMFKTLEEK